MILARKHIFTLFSVICCGSISIAFAKTTKTGHLYEKPQDDREAEAGDSGESMIAKQFKDFEQTTDDDTLICEGEVTLTRLKCPEDACDGAGKCTGCRAYFCQIDFDLQKEAPSYVPTFLDLVGLSNHCDAGMIRKDFNEIVAKCKDYDSTASRRSDLPKNIPLKGLITDLGNTDADLITNAIASSSHEVRVIVEPQPVLESMGMCDLYEKNRMKRLKGNSNVCNREAASELLKDVVFMLGRSRDSEEQQMIIRTNPESTPGLDIYENAFPNLQWLFVYGEPTEAIGSQMGRFKMERAVCVRTKRNPPPKMEAFLEESGLSVETASLEEYCAATLALLADAAVERGNSSKGTFVASDEALSKLPNLLSDVFGISVSQEKVAKLQIGGHTDNEGKVDDNLQEKRRQEKIARATDKLKTASNNLYGPKFEKLQMLKSKRGPI